MARSGARTVTPSVHTTVRTARSTLSFYQADCLDVFASLPSDSVSVIVTSPPYNLGIEYRSYDDSLPRAEYLQWTEAWTAAAARVLEPEGSLFLNLGAKPTDPWTAMDIAQAARKCLHLQNTIHWIKSIAIDKDAAGLAAGLERDLAVGHYKPINSPRFLNDCHEFIFHFTPAGTDAARSPRHRRRVPGRFEHRPVALGRRQPPLPGQRLVHSLRHHQEPRQGPPAPRHLPAAARRVPACDCTAGNGRGRRWTPSSGSGARPWPRRGWTSISSAWRSTGTTSRKASAGSTKS